MGFSDQFSKHDRVILPIMGLGGQSTVKMSMSSDIKDISSSTLIRSLGLCKKEGYRSTPA